MQIQEFLRFLHTVEKCKCNTRHSWTSSGRHESVAEHSWRLALMAMLCRTEYPALDMDRVVQMCLVHDLGEAVTGDIPSFLKTGADEKKEDDAIRALLTQLPSPERESLASLFSEMQACTTPEARLYKALDNMEAVLSHNEAPLSTWIPLEYSENRIYGNDTAAFSPYTQALREALLAETDAKLREAGLPASEPNNDTQA